MSGDKSLIGFCSAPWTDCITYADGALRACDRNDTSFGNWQEGGLYSTWHSDQFQEFRRLMAEGKYPNESCASCHNNGTQRTAHSSLVGAFVVHQEFLNVHFGKSFPELEKMHEILFRKTRDEESDAALASYFGLINALRTSPDFSTNPQVHQAVVKLQVIGESLEDYLAGELKPRRLATFRQSQLQAKCTARCVMCAGKYTGEIVSGPTMDAKYVDEAFARPEDITDFWCNGAEYLFYKEWKKVALMLAEQGVKLRLSTNGILLNEATIQFIIDNKILRFLTLSLDAATKETLESTRVNVKFDKVMERIRFLLKYSAERNYIFEFTAAFVLMKRNLHELPAFVRLIHSLRPKNCRNLITVLCQPLENFDVEGYRRFVHQEHHTLLGEQELRRIFTETHKAGKETGVSVTFYNQKLNDFMESGMPIPAFFPRRSDVDLILADIAAIDQRFPVVFNEIWNEIESWLRRSGFQRDKLRELLATHLHQLNFGSEVIRVTAEKFPDLQEKIDQCTEKFVNRIIHKIDAATVVHRHNGKALATKKYVIDPISKGQGVFLESGFRATALLAIFGNRALLMNGYVIPLQKLKVLAETDGRAVTVGIPGASLVLIGFLHSAIHYAKERLIGNRKSKLLWKLSVIYRSTLKFLGFNVPTFNFENDSG
ncbi:MAG TPA: radical SAM/SPASM domain-containing protein [Bdellovibrionota bacterium]|jgi:sulfatase maturation enzyme AslB (radical SAM superfamily)